MAINVFVATRGHHNADATGRVVDGVHDMARPPTEHRGPQRGRDIQTGMGPQLTVTTTTKTVMTGISLKDSDGKRTRLLADISLSRHLD